MGTKVSKKIQVVPPPPAVESQISHGVGLRIKQQREDRGLNQTELGDLVGLSKQTVLRFENAKKSPTVEELLRIAKVLRADEAWLLTGRGVGPAFITDLPPSDRALDAPPPGFTKIRVFAAKAAAGSGLEPEDWLDGYHLVPDAQMADLGVPERQLVVVDVDGNSMRSEDPELDLRDKDRIFVVLDPDVRERQSVVCLNGHVKVKNIRFRNGGIVLDSSNKDGTWPDEPVKPTDQFRVVGRVKGLCYRKQA